MNKAFSLGIGLMVLVGSSTAAEVDFERDIRPLLERRCFECHDASKQLSGLRLDVRSSAMRGGESGVPTVVPGDAAGSELLRRVTSTEDYEMMPPEGERLSDAEVGLLRTWIETGANWPDEWAGEDPDKINHWAFQPPVRPELPSLQNVAWARNAIDHFVLARLEAEGLTPTAEADRTTLIRRLSLDLLGLPPSIAEVDAFLADTADDAYERLVERLLASPHYGERWGRHWLDAARYADSDGFEKDKSRQVWFYRDWVIDALNRDLPYDRFIIQQLAGDLLPDAGQDEIVATGFLRNSMTNEEGGIDPEQFRMEAMFDRMDAIGKSILGLTIQCAQCHNHKFDPLTQEAYYQLFALLNNDFEANVAVYTADEQMQRAELFRAIGEIEAELQHQHADWPQRMAAWEASVRDDQPDWIVLQPEAEDNSTGGQKYLPQPDGSLLAQGYAPTKNRVQLVAQTDLPRIGAFRLELLTHPNLPLHGPGRSIFGTGALSEFEVEVAPADAPDQMKKVKFIRASADVNPPERPLDAVFDDRTDKRRVTGPASMAIDGNRDTAWSHDLGPGRRNRAVKAVFVPEQPLEFESGMRLNIYLSQYHGGWNSNDNQSHNLGRMRLSVTDADDVVADPLPAAVREVLSIAPEQRTPRQSAALFSYWRTTVPEWSEANERIEALWPQHPAGSSQLVLEARDQPRTTHVLKRGDFLHPDRAVEAGVPDFLHPLPDDAPPTRLTFARWLVDRQSPTTARSIVNRVWQAYFGVGLVSTSEDLGTQSPAPSHPELLDWLAVELMDRGWSLKELHRQIVHSATYRQMSQAEPSRYAHDPENRLLGRGARFRVEAEVVRDIALAASGLLNPQVGGPSMYPPLPEFMLEPPVSYGTKIWPLSTGAEAYRRAMYIFRYRSVPYPMLQTFDAPTGDFSCVRRARSNTPLQALVTLNEPVFVEAARALAAQTLREASSDDAGRLDYAFRRCVARPPTTEERTELLDFYARQIRRLNEGWLSPRALLGVEELEIPRLPEGATPTELAAWTAVSRVLLNLDETITKQ